jgi:hypothetical protein
MWWAVQSVTPTLALGGEVFWLGQQRKSGIGFAGRYNTDKAVWICLLQTLQFYVLDLSHFLPKCILPVHTCPMVVEFSCLCKRQSLILIDHFCKNP